MREGGGGFSPVEASLAHCPKPRTLTHRVISVEEDRHKDEVSLQPERVDVTVNVLPFAVPVNLQVIVVALHTCNQRHVTSH